MSELELLSPFAHFEPFTGNLKSAFFDQASSIANRARNLLRHRNREQVEYMVETINYMFAYRDPMQLMLDQLDSEEGDANSFPDILAENPETFPLEPLQAPGLPGKTFSSHPFWWFTSPGHALSRCMEIFDISDQEQVPNAGWHEYFAALALALVAESQYDEYRGHLDNEANDHLAALREAHHVGEHLLQAMEALGKAELLLSLNEQRKDAEAEARQRVRVNQVNAAITRHTDSNNTKADYIRWLKDSYIPSLESPSQINHSAAAREYYEEFLVPDPPLEPESAFRHRENWLRKLKEAERLIRKTKESPQTGTDITT